VIRADEPYHPDVVEQAGQNHLLAVTVLQGVGSALEQVILGRREPVLEEVKQGRFLRHLRQAWIVAHQHVLGWVGGRRGRLGRIEITGREQHRLADPPVELLHHVLFELFGTLGEGGTGREGDALSEACWREIFRRFRCDRWSLLWRHTAAP